MNARIIVFQLLSPCYTANSHNMTNANLLSPSMKQGTPWIAHSYSEDQIIPSFLCNLRYNLKGPLSCLLPNQTNTLLSLTVYSLVSILISFFQQHFSVPVIYWPKLHMHFSSVLGMLHVPPISSSSI